MPLAFTAPEQWGPLCIAAEAAGFEMIIVSDHLAYPEYLETPYPYTADGQPRWGPTAPWPDPLVAIAGLAAMTERIQFATSVYVLPLRHPVVAAKQVATASVFANGRLTLGVGAGWMKEEFELLGTPFRARGRRMMEAVEIMRALWHGGMREHHGEFYDFGPIEQSPIPTTKIPFWGGGTSDVALQRAASSFDGWVSEIQTTDEIGDIIRVLRNYRARTERAREPFEICAAVKDAYTTDRYRYLFDQGVTYLVTVPWLIYGEMEEDVRKRCDALRRFGEEVISHFS